MNQPGEQLDRPLAGARQGKSKRHATLSARLGFLGGMLTGAGLSSLVPWRTLEAVAPGARLACVAGLGVGFVTFRILAKKRHLRMATGAVTVAIGGFLLSAGPHFSFLGIDVMVVEIGAVSFLCGLTLLFRSRTPSPEEREQTVERLVSDVPVSVSPPSDRVISRAEALRCLEGSFEEPATNASDDQAARLASALSQWQEDHADKDFAKVTTPVANSNGRLEGKSGGTSR